MIIGLTGPMCSGKNVAAEWFSKSSYAVIDADQIAHEAIEAKKSEIVKEFGEFILKPNGSIDRKILASIVFSDPSLLKKHENIIYPYINDTLQKFVDNHPYENVVINAPLLYKSDILKKCSIIVYVNSPLIIRLFRAIKRDNSSIIKVLKRFKNQKKMIRYYKDYHVYKIYNIGSKNRLFKKIDHIMNFF